ncbi:MAG: HAMP domain-containing sensor histidine kinase [Candidatus Falkowbacteria bacterium]
MENKGGHFLRDNKQIIYSIILLFVIPSAIVFNSALFSMSYKKTIDQTLYTTAVTAGKLVNVALLNEFSDWTAVQQKIETIASYEPNIKSLDVLVFDQEKFVVKASLTKSLINKTTVSGAYLIAWSRDYPTAQQVSEDGGVGRQRAWLVTMPLKDVMGQKKALLALKITTEAVDKFSNDTLVRSYWILLATLLVIILLLFANSRLFEYAGLYKKLKEVDDMKDEFVSMASHELRTPITVIQGYADIIMKDKTGQLVVNDKVKEFLTMMSASAERLRLLVEDLLNVSRIQQGRLEVKLTPVKLGEVIAQTVKELTLSAQQKNLALTYTDKAEPGMLVLVDKDRFKQVIINIIGNAIKYTEKGSVEVGLELDGKNAIMRVKDTGIGISTKDREKLFQKFYRVQSSQTAKISGTGLGLWITKQIVEMMQGQIELESMSGVGTEVILQFPIANK